MATITKQPVTLTVPETELVLRILAAYASSQWTSARRTKSPSIRDHCETVGRQAADLDAELVRRLYVQS
jgi:hypothetical protein